MTATQEIIGKLNCKERGTLLAQNHEDDIQRQHGCFTVPSQTSDKEYRVKIGKEWNCSCPDHQNRDTKCKHMWAVELKITKSVDEDGNVEITKEVEETGQNWTAYNAAQTSEHRIFMELLADLS